MLSPYVVTSDNNLQESDSRKLPDRGRPASSDTNVSIAEILKDYLRKKSSRLTGLKMQKCLIRGENGIRLGINVYGRFPFNHLTDNRGVLATVSFEDVQYRRRGVGGARYEQAA